MFKWQNPGVRVLIPNHNCACETEAAWWLSQEIHAAIPLLHEERLSPKTSRNTEHSLKYLLLYLPFVESTGSTSEGWRKCRPFFTRRDILITPRKCGASWEGSKHWSPASSWLGFLMAVSAAWVNLGRRAGCSFKFEITGRSVRPVFVFEEAFRGQKSGSHRPKLDWDFSAQSLWKKHFLFSAPREWGLPWWPQTSALSSWPADQRGQVLQGDRSASQPGGHARLPGELFPLDFLKWHDNILKNVWTWKAKSQPSGLC